jgi:hypothetical protein
MHTPFFPCDVNEPYADPRIKGDRKRHLFAYFLYVCGEDGQITCSRLFMYIVRLTLWMLPSRTIVYVTPCGGEADIVGAEI